ncbi:MAG: DedA family protein [Bacteroidales bacterium]
MLEHFSSLETALEFFANIAPLAIYLWVMGLMIIESSFVPFPSEIIIPPAVIIAITAGTVSVPIIVLVGTLGALIGAYVNYYMGWYLGRPVIHKLANTRLAHAFLIDQHKVEKAETYFLKNGKVSTLIGRLIPGIRQLISIPAGISKMPVAAFSLYTFIGAFVWNIILAIIGYICACNLEHFSSIFHELKIAFLTLGGLFICYLIYKAWATKSK